MSEDRTQDINEKYDTRPTVETILERMALMEGRINARIESLGGKLSAIHERLEQMDTRLDRTQAMVHDMRADFREFRAQFKEPA